YDPKFQSTYWARWVMGVVSGLILSQLIWVFLLKPSTTEASVAPATVGQPLLALLGGYSSDLVQGILSRTIETVASFFHVSGATAVDARARTAGRDAGRSTRASDPVDLPRDLARTPDADEASANLTR